MWRGSGLGVDGVWRGLSSSFLGGGSHVSDRLGWP